MLLHNCDISVGLHYRHNLFTRGNVQSVSLSYYHTSDSLTNEYQNNHTSRQPPTPTRSSSYMFYSKMACKFDNGDEIPKEGPMHPEYSGLPARMRSFENWPKQMSQTPDQCAEAGFMYTGRYKAGVPLTDYKRFGGPVVGGSIG